VAQKTGIEWTDVSSNPLKYRDRATGKDVWACVKTSPGCAHCYSEALAERFDRGGPFTSAAMEKVEPYLCEKELMRLLGSKTLTGKRVFLCDMTDVFGDWVSDEMLDKLFAVLALRADVTFQVLTKRAERMKAYFATPCRLALIHVIQPLLSHRMPCSLPLPNVWLGASVENQATADERIPHLLATPAAVRFLSCEPLLGPLDLTRLWLADKSGWWNGLDGRLTCKAVSVAGQELWAETEQPLSPRVDWVIVGGESGAGARPMHLDWARAIIRQCRAANTAVFCKQLGSAATDEVNGLAGAGLVVPEEAAGLVSLRLRDRKGGDMEEWPSDLRVREFPGVT
jgi:protein gp37